MKSFKIRLTSKLKNLNRYILPLFIIWSIWISAEFLLGPFAHVRISDSGMGGVGGIPELIAVKNQIIKYGPSYFGNFLPGGVDLASNLHLPFSHLNSILFFIFPGSVAYGFLMLIQRFISSYFTFRLCRDSLKFTLWPSVFAGLAYSLFNFSIFNFTTFHQLSEPGIPLFLWALDRLDFIKSKKKYSLAALLGLFWGYSTYIPYGIPILIPLSAVWFLIIVRKKNMSFWLMFLITAASATLVQIPQIWSLILNAPRSERIERQFLPNHSFFINYISDVQNPIAQFKLQLIVIIGGIFLLKKLIVSRLILLILILTLVVLLGSPLLSILQYLIPNLFGFTKSFQFVRFNIIIPLFLTLLSAMILDKVLISPKYSSNLKIILISIIFGVAIIQSIKIKIQTLFNYAPYKTLYEIPDLKELSEKDKSIYRVATVTGGGVRPAYAYAYGLETVDGYMALYPQSYYDFWGKVISKIITNDREKYEDYISMGSRIYLYGPKDYDNLDIIEFEKYYDLNLLSLANVKYIISRKPLEGNKLVLLQSQYREEIKDWKQLTNTQKVFYFLKGRYFGPSLYIYENKNVLPRFFILKEGKIVNGDVIVEQYSPDLIKLSVTLNDDSQLIASINYYPFWHVSVDGKQREVYKYLDTFMTINVYKNEHSITFKYSPPYAAF